MHIIGLLLGSFIGAAFFHGWGALFGAIIALCITAQIASSDIANKFLSLRKKIDSQDIKILELEAKIAALEIAPSSEVLNQTDVVAEKALENFQLMRVNEDVQTDAEQAVALEKVMNETRASLDGVKNSAEKIHNDGKKRVETSSNDLSTAIALEQALSEPVLKVNVPDAEPIFVNRVKQSLQHDAAQENADKLSLADSNADITLDINEKEKSAQSSNSNHQGAEELPFMKIVDKVSSWFLRGNPILKVGAIILFLGLAFLLRYVAQHTYFPIELRYASVAFAAFALTAVGWKVRKKNPPTALILQGLGIGVFYLTIFAAIKLHPLIPPFMGFVILVVVAAAAIVLALLQNSISLMLAATIGGFAAPILASTGGGSHIGLFTYFAILDMAILIIAWFKSWRILNIVGFFGTFSIGMAWASSSYQSSFYVSTQLFLIFFFLLFVAIALLFARRQLLENSHDESGNERSLRSAALQTYYVDGTLFFGVPIIGFGLQYALVQHIEMGPAYSAFILGGFYIALAFGTLKRGQNALQLLFETCLVLGLVFASLAVPLAFDAEWTTSIWAVEAAAIYWLSLRQNHFSSRCFSLIVLVGSVVSWFVTIREGGQQTVIVASKLGIVLIALSLVFTWWHASRANKSRMMAWERNIPAILGCLSTISIGLAPSVFFSYYGATILTAILSAIMFVGGLKLSDIVIKITATIIFFYTGYIYLVGVSDQYIYELFSADFIPVFILSLSLLFSALSIQYLGKNDDLTDKILEGIFVGYMVFAWAFAVFATINYSAVGLTKIHGILAVSIASFSVWGLLARHYQWRILANVSLCWAPYAFCLFICAFGTNISLIVGTPDISKVIFLSLYQPWVNWGWLLWPAIILLHCAILFALLPLINQMLTRIVHVTGAWLTIGLVSATCSAMLMDVSGNFNAWRWLGWIVGPVIYLLMVAANKPRWPLKTDPTAYRFFAAWPVAVIAFGWIWFANIINDGSATPLPYIPLINPLEFGLFITLFALFIWSNTEPLVKKNLPPYSILVAFGFTSFAILTATILRSVHHFFGVDWRAAALFASTTAQTTLAIVWTVVALSAMLVGNRKKLRILWICGTSLIGVVVFKLFAIDLGGSGTMERIISFTSVGLLLLIIGYFAPLPPKEKTQQADDVKHNEEQPL